MTERGIRVPSLPLELWSLILLQNTDPKHLWIVGRQVCTTWRSEIPKIVAKKYLEVRNMTKIYSHCWHGNRTTACLMGPELVYSHYRNPDRMVFVRSEHEDDHVEECTKRHAHASKAESQNISDFAHYTICHECVDKAGGRRCDLPFYYIHIKRDVHDTELPGLEVEFKSGEISFEWEAMLTSFYREAAVLDRRNDELANKAVQWFKEGKRSIASILLRALEDEKTLWNYKKQVRRDRIKSWHRYSSSLENTSRSDHEDAFDEYEIWRGLVRCSKNQAKSEDSDGQQKWEYQSRSDTQLDMFGPLRLKSYEKDEHGDSSLRGLLFDCFGWSSMAPKDKEELETRCVLQWLGRGRIQSMPATTTEHD